MQPPTWMQHTTEHITIFTAHCKKSTLHQCSISSRILFELPLCMEWLATWKDVCRAQYGGRRLTNVDYWWQSSIRMLCSFVRRRKKIGCATFSLNARATPPTLPAPHPNYQDKWKMSSQMDVAPWCSKWTGWDWISPGGVGYRVALIKETCKESIFVGSQSYVKI